MHTLLLLAQKKYGRFAGRSLKSIRTAKQSLLRPYMDLQVLAHLLGNILQTVWSMLAICHARPTQTFGSSLKQSQAQDFNITHMY